MISYKIRHELINLRNHLKELSYFDDALKNACNVSSVLVQRILDKHNIPSQIINTNTHCFNLCDGNRIIDLTFSQYNLHVPFLIDKEMSLIKNHIPQDDYYHFDLNNVKFNGKISDILKVVESDKFSTRSDDALALSSFLPIYCEYFGINDNKFVNDIKNLKDPISVNKHYEYLIKHYF